MELSDVQKESILKSAEELLDGEIPDELLETINGGRTPYKEEADVVIKLSKQKRQEVYEGKISSKEYVKLFDAAVRYVNYIVSLPLGSDPVLFVYEEWRDDDAE